MAEMNGIEVASETAARPSGLSVGLGVIPLALILLYGIDMSKARDFLEKILTLKLTHSGQKLPIIYAPVHIARASGRAHPLRRSTLLQA